MNKRMRFCILLCILSMIAVFSGCERKVYQYSFDQPFSNVVKVEVCQYDYTVHQNKDDYVTLIAELDLETADLLIEKLAELPCYRHWGDFPRDSYSEFILYVTYADGEAEVLGKANCASVHTDGTWWPKGYYFDQQQWSEVLDVLTEHVEPELIPELDKDLE